jgi:hypothetical protein
MLLQARSGLIAAQAQRLADTVALGAALAGDPMRQVREDQQPAAFHQIPQAK